MSKKNISNISFNFVIKTYYIKLNAVDDVYNIILILLYILILYIYIYIYIYI